MCVCVCVCVCVCECIRIYASTFEKKERKKEEKYVGEKQNMPGEIYMCITFFYENNVFFNFSCRRINFQNFFNHIYSRFFTCFQIKLTLELKRKIILNEIRQE